MNTSSAETKKGADLSRYQSQSIIVAVTLHSQVNARYVCNRAAYETHSNPFQLPPSLTHPPPPPVPPPRLRETVAASLSVFSMDPGGFILLTAPSLLCIEKHSIPFQVKGRWKQWGFGGRGGVGAKDGPRNKTSDPKLMVLISSREKKGQCETDSRKGGDEGSREEGEEAGEEGGKEGGKKHKGTKECVIKTGNGRREEGSGGFQKEAGRGRFSRERRSGTDTRAV